MRELGFPDRADSRHQQPRYLLVTGFRVYRLPCEVTGIRAMLHMRNNGLIIPPTPSETIAEATLTESLHIRR